VPALVTAVERVVVGVGDPAVVALVAAATQLGGLDHCQAWVVVMGVKLAKERGEHHRGSGADPVVGQRGHQAADLADRPDRVQKVLRGPDGSGHGEPLQGVLEPPWGL